MIDVDSQVREFFSAQGVTSEKALEKLFDEMDKWMDKRVSWNEFYAHYRTKKMSKHECTLEEVWQPSSSCIYLESTFGSRVSRTCYLF